MAFHRVQTWYPSFNDIQPDPNSPFRNVVPQVLDIPLNPQEIRYREICGMLKYAEDNKRTVTKDKKKYSRELRVALMRLDVGGGEGRNGRERMRKVVLLQKVVQSHQSYKNGLMVCEGELWRKEKELKGLLKLRAQENGNAGYYEGRNWWFVTEAEESDEEDDEDHDEDDDDEDDDDDDEGDDDDDDDEMDEGDEGEETEGMELECWSE
ncbi:hypothetical protein ACHAP3_009707 [Botrytis cinerea]